jgi:phage major head subunit gpT-like protein
MAIQEQWAELLEPGLRSIFYLQYSELAAESRVPMLFNVMGSTKAEEHFLGIGGMSDWEEYKGAIEFDEQEEGFKTTLTHAEYSKGFWVERKLVDDDQYNEISTRPQALALSAARTREKHAASVFNNAFSGSYLGGDSKALCADDHPYSPTVSTAIDNKGTTALSYDAVVSTRRLMREFVDDKGEIIAMNPDLLLVPPELEETANAIVNTMQSGQPQKVDTADYHDSLVGRVGIRFLVWDYLTDANNWFMLDSRMAKVHLKWLNRVPLEFAMDPASSFNLRARYRGYMRYSYGWSDFRWVYGHAVT